MNNPLVTVYIPSHNKGQFLEEAIESVLKQSMTDWELILIDDNSSDETPSIMARYQNNEKVQMFRTDGIGLPSVCNFAIGKSRGEYIIRLDGDDVFDENILLILANHLNRYSHVDLVFPDYYIVDSQGQIMSHETRKRIYHQNHLMDMPPNGACTMVRRRVFDELDGYREDLGVQDGFDLWSRMTASGFMGDNVQLPLFLYRRHDTNITNNTQRIALARQTIKKDCCQESLDKYRPFTAVIPCRQHYDFRDDLWDAPLNGQSLLERKLEKCLASEMFDSVVVACDNPAVRDVLSGYDDPRLHFHQRRPEQTLRSVPLGIALREILPQYDKKMCGLTLTNYIQTPFVSTASMEEAIHTLIMNEADCSVGVNEINFTVFQRTPNGLMPLNSVQEIRSDFDRVYCESQTTLATLSRNVRNGSLTGAKVVYYNLPEDEEYFVDSERKLTIATLLKKEFGL